MISINGIKSTSDEELMRSFSQFKDETTFAEIYKRYFASLSKYIGWLSSNIEQGKDIAQNILLKVYQEPSAFDASRNFKVWLFSIAKNQWKNELRSDAIKEKYLQNLRVVPEEEEPKDEMENKVLLKKALAKLSENHREIFVLKYSNNLTIKEISKICACSEGTVKSRLFYAMKYLKDQLKTKEY